MPNGDLTAEVLFGWDGYSVDSVEKVSSRGRVEQVQIRLRADPDRVLRCSACGQEAAGVHDVTPRWVRDLPVFEAKAWVQVPRCRVDCRHCGGPKLEALAWLDPYARITHRLAQSVVRLCHVLPIKQVAEYFGLSWGCVKAVHKAYLDRELGPVCVRGVRLLLMDEFSIQKGHRYATVIADAERRRVLWVGRGRSRDSVRPFFQLLGAEGCRQIRAVGMDMNAAYELEIQDFCPQADIVFDLFHVVAKYGREVLDRVRIEETQRAEKGSPTRRVLTGSKWLLLRNASNLSDEAQVTLDELLAINQPLMTAYVLKDDLKQLWRHNDAEQAERATRSWIQRALASGIPALQRFARNLRRYAHGIVAHARWQLNTSVLEGINNKIKLIKRMAYGFRDDEYFFLRIRAAFPGIR